MNKNVAKIFIIAMLMFVPGTAKADIDVLSAIQDTITSAMEKVDTVVKQYTNIQFNLQELSLNRNIVSQLRDEIKTQINDQAVKIYGEVKDLALSEMKMFVKTSLSSITLPGIGQYVDLGAFVSPKLKVAVGETYIKRQHKDNDIAYNLQQDKKKNDLAIENAATLFANSLVRRVQIIEEDPCRCVNEDGSLVSDMPRCSQDEKETCDKQRKRMNELKDVNSVKEMYYEKVMTGHHRWERIAEALSAYKKMQNEVQMGQGNVEDISDVTGVAEETGEEEKNNAFEDYMQKQREANAQALSGIVTNGINQIKNGDALGFVAGTAGTAANVYANAPGSWSNVATAMQETATGLSAANNAYESAKTGNWGGALGAAAGGAGAIVGDTGNQALGNVFGNAASGAGDALNAGLNNNWSGLAGAVGTSAGSAVSGSGNEVLGAAITTGGNLTGVGVNAADTGISWDNINNTLGQTQSALGTMENAYNVQNQQNAEIVKAKEEADKKAAEEAEAARKAAEETAKADAKVEAGTNEMIEYMKKACAECKADKKKTQADCLYTCSYQ